MGKRKQKFEISPNEPKENIVQLGKRKRFHPQDLVSFAPKTERQKEFLHAYYSETPIIIQTGCAGTGKTLTSLYAAMSDVVNRDSVYERLIIIRSAVEARQQGFLPGSQEEKDEPYEEPYRAILDSIFKFNECYDNLKSLGYVEFRTTGYLRGVTFDNAIVYIDEVQNMDFKEIETIISRLGVNSKIILSGDTKQNDLWRKRETSGLGKLKRVFDQMPMESVADIEYQIDDIVRSGLVKEFIRACHCIDD
jgi:phosphate starvation-inducible PhoH-like protein